KESIQINLLCHSEVIDRQSIKNPAPLEESGVCGRARAAANPVVSANFLAQKQKDLTFKSKVFEKMAPHLESQRTIAIILPNTIHGCKKKNL
ncbi:MAG: hypothetical protein WC549_07515, partial [Actinomycetota bacterium]